jgi:hypothetical protein
VSTAPKGALVALKERREQVIELLCEQFSKDTLEVDEFEERIDRAHRAVSVSELDALVADLMTATDSRPVPATLQPAVALSLRPDHPRSANLFAVLGGSERTGVWRVPRVIRTVICMGGTLLDFREAIFSPGVTELHVYGVMGGCHVLVPPGLPVECHGTGIMGGFQSLERRSHDLDPDAPLLRVRGFVVMGGVDVETRLPGESEREAKKRRKRERRTRSRRLRRQRPDKLLGDG